ncbi:carboxypeptidase M32 [Sporolactobacillus shoreicorticis]|uniref:Metal-dependent carboxypeptidase n=1 Tax=Sporolactobacillus shoreicorticis TaxID=1923877 RepID=A0ABW5S7I8_9BACL|nr:carboxypeptidase M32 [Sporolactobacillus shoreicorticis]MCO7125736.1 carboxypeptidase M32 [Sporolactobacillus shoreicorticis]
MAITEIVDSYNKHVKKIMDFNESIALAEWDMRTGAPKKGIKQRSEVVGTLSDEVFKRSTSDEMKGYIDALTDPAVQDQLSLVTKRMIEDSKKTYDRFINIPSEENKAYVILQSEAQDVWKEAKEKSDFAMLQPYLEKMVAFKRKFIEYWGIKKNKYDALLDLYEPGVTVKTIDQVFDKLRKGLIPLVEAVAASKDQPEKAFLSVPFPIEKQKALCLHLLKEIGYDFDAGRLDETEHPFEITLNPGDVRVTTNYQETDFISTVLGTIHEGGHALYEQHISRELVGTPLCAGTSMGIHESQSLFFENFIGRSKAFWSCHYEELKRFANGQFDGISLDDFYRAINVSQPSLIRTLADELTYPLHIMVRYDIEKGLFNGELSVKDLPGVWNEKMNEYLGITPNNDREGVLQDIHWPGGDFGYFPSYALGYVYAAQFKNTMVKDIPDFNVRVGSGDLKVVTEWLSKHIHQFGSLKKPLKILNDTTEEGPNPNYLLNDLSKKYSDIYRL